MRGKLKGVLVAILAVCVSMVCASTALGDFGVASFDNTVTNQDGSPALQAGGHPFQITTAFTLNTETNPRTGLEAPEANIKDAVVELPAGFVGNPSATPKCPGFLLERELGSACPHDTQIGLAKLVVSFFGGPALLTITPVYNMQTPPDLPARFGFNAAGVLTVLDSSVRTGGDYGIDVTIRNIPEFVDLVTSTVTLWGVPADPAHDAQRCPFQGPNGCNGEFGSDGNEPHSSDAPLAPLLTNPTDCSTPLTSSIQVDSWEHPGVFTGTSGPIAHLEDGTPLAFTGCDQLSFEPSIAVAPQSRRADAPTGLDVDLRVPQVETPGGLATPELKKAVVRLPAGLAVSPAAADGLQACSPDQIGLSGAGAPSCPDASKVGSVQIDTPLLSTPLVGSVYLAQQGNNPFGSLLAIYLVAEGSGVLLKLPGQIAADPATGQLTTTFDNTPQMPFSELRLSFFGGARAALVNPSSCGTYTAGSELTPWSGGAAATPSSSFTIDEGCAASQPFAPVLTAGTSNPQGGGFSPFTMTLTRSDGQQPLGGVALRLPPGLLGILKSVPLCAEAQAAAGTCGAESLVGHTTVGAGAGSNPFYLGGQVFLTGPYKGAPFGLSIVVPAVAGPFNLGTVVVRARIEVDPHTTQLTITSDALPTILQGIPLDLRVVNVTVDREGFTFNPTDCEAQSIAGTVTSTAGASVAEAEHFQAANCAALPFAPRFSASSVAKTSRAGGAALDVKVAYPQGAQANIAKVAVTLPKQLPARLSTIQQACPAATFEANPASCGEGSMVGVGTASTPVFSRPLTGPAYLVSHGGESFPDIVVVLQGEGVTIQLVGNVFITKAGITSATFAHVPDAPIGAFDLNLPEGPHSALSAVGNLCSSGLTMPTTITGQNGAVVKQTTKIKVPGCPKAKKKAKKHKRHKQAGKHRRAKKSRTARRPGVGGSIG